MNIGDVYHGNWQMLGKLGYGSTSTVWLARDLRYGLFSTQKQNVALEIFARDSGDDAEGFQLCKPLTEGSHSHPGYPHVRTTALDLFEVERPGGGLHQCLVQKPMWDSFRDVVHRNPDGRFTEELLKPALYQLVAALDYLHSKGRLVHAIKVPRIPG